MIAVGVLGEAPPRLAHLDAEAVELDAPEAPSEAEHRPAAGEVVEQREVLDDTHRVVPRQHRDHRAELDPRRLAGDPGQELRHVRRQLVVGEVVLGRPHRVEPDVLGPRCERQLVAVHLGVGDLAVEVLEDEAESGVHGCSVRGWGIGGRERSAASRHRPRPGAGRRVTTGPRRGGR